MGLDMVELVVRVEETFHITIKDEEAEKITTVGALYECVLGKLGETEVTGCLSLAAFHRLRRALMSRFAVPRNSVRLEARVTDLIPPRARREQWRRLGEELGLKLPRLARPRWLAYGIFLAPLVALGAVAVSSARGSFESPSARSLFAGAILFWASAALLTAPFATRIPSDCLTVRGLTGTLLNLNFGALTEDKQRWSKLEVWEVLQAIIVDELGVTPEQVKPGARFIEDLGVG
jgi:acyl carrier protein